MNIDFFAHERVHLLGDGATRPTEPSWGALGALLRLAGSSPLRCRAYPAHPHDGPFGRVQLPFLGSNVNAGKSCNITPYYLNIPNQFRRIAAIAIDRPLVL